MCISVEGIMMIYIEFGQVVQEKMQFIDLMLSRALTVPLFSRVEPFVQFCLKVLTGTFL